MLPESPAVVSWMPHTMQKDLYHSHVCMLNIKLEPGDSLFRLALKQVQILVSIINIQYQTAKEKINRHFFQSVTQLFS